MFPTATFVPQAARITCWRKLDDSRKVYNSWRGQFARTDTSVAPHTAAAAPFTRLLEQTLCLGRVLAAGFVDVHVRRGNPWRTHATLPSRRAVLTLVAALVAAFVVHAKAYAQYVTYAFAGTIDESDSPLVHVGDPFSGRFTYGLIHPDLSPRDPAFGQYQALAFASGGIVGMVYVAGSVSVDATGFSIWNVVNAATDRFSFSSIASLRKPNAARGLVRFEDPTGLVFSSDQVPLTLDLADFAMRRFSGGGQPTGGSFSGEIDSLRLVPEPASFGLTLVLLTAVAVARRTLFGKSKYHHGTNDE
jgi:hypothetical protein